MSYEVLYLILSKAYIKTEDPNDMELVDFLVSHISVIQDSASAIKVITLIIIYLVFFLRLYTLSCMNSFLHTCYCVSFFILFIPILFLGYIVFLNGSEENLWF